MKQINNLVFKSTIITLLFFTSIQLYSQNSFPHKVSSKYISEVYDITYKKPKGFMDRKEGGFLRLRPDISSWVIIYGAKFQSKDKKCIILYPSYLTFLYRDISPKEQAISEINTLLGNSDKVLRTTKGPLFEFDKYVKLLSDEEATECFNADTVYVAELPLHKAYEENYRYCTGYYLFKKGRPTISIKVFFTEEGKQDEDEYFSRLCGKVFYRNDDWQYDAEKENKAFRNILYKGRYPGRK